LVSPTTIRSRILKGKHNKLQLLFYGSFTHNDPFEDTERGKSRSELTNSRCFTHNDPFEDTESGNRRGSHVNVVVGFTHNDPFEDTERIGGNKMFDNYVVSPTTIRSRILKAYYDIQHRHTTETFHPQRSVRGY